MNTFVFLLALIRVIMGVWVQSSCGGNKKISDNPDNHCGVFDKRKCWKIDKWYSEDGQENKSVHVSKALHVKLFSLALYTGAMQCHVWPVVTVVLWLS